MKRWNKILHAIIVMAMAMALLMCGSALAEEAAYGFYYETIYGTDDIRITGIEYYDEEGESLHVVIPAEIDGKKVLEIGERAFYEDWYMKSVEVSEGIESIGEYAFEYAGLKTIALPETITSIGDGAFSGSELQEIELPDSVAYFGSDIFRWCESITRVVLPETIETIPEDMFYRAGITQIDIPASVTSIGYEAFAESKIENIVIPEGVDSIGDYAFAWSKLKTIVIPESVETFGEDIFEGIETQIEKFYVFQNSPAHEYAAKHGIPCIPYNVEQPRIIGIEGLGRKVYALNKPIDMEIDMVGAGEDVEYSYEITGNGKIVKSGTQDNAAVFSFTPEAEGTYVIRVSAINRNDSGDAACEFVSDPFLAKEGVSDVPEIINFVMHSPDEIKYDTPIIFSYRIVGGDGYFRARMEDSLKVYMLVDGEPVEYEYDSDIPEPETWFINEAEGYYVKTTFLPRVTGKYFFEITPRDDSGVYGETLSTQDDPITVKESTFKITAVKTDLPSVTVTETDWEWDDELDREVEVTRKVKKYYSNVGKTATWDIDTNAGKNDKVSYSLKLIGYNREIDPEAIWAEIVSGSDKISHTFTMEAEDMYAHITAYNETTGQMANFVTDYFDVYEAGITYFPWWYADYDYYDDNLVGGTKEWYAYGDEEFEEAFEAGEMSLRYELYCDGEKIDESQWLSFDPDEDVFEPEDEYSSILSEFSSFSHTFEKAGHYELISIAKKSNGEVKRKSVDDFYVCKDGLDVWFATNYSESDMSLIKWEVEASLYRGCSEEDRAYVDFMLYKDGGEEPVYEETVAAEANKYSYYYTGFEKVVAKYRPDDFGVYEMKAVVRVDFADESKTDIQEGPFTFEKVEIAKPSVSRIDTGFTGNYGAWTGQVIAWNIYVNGGLHPEKNVAHAILYKDGEVYKTFDDVAMTGEENYGFGGFHSYARIAEAMVEPGVYHMEAWAEDDLGNRTESKSSGQLRVFAYASSQFVMEAVTASPISTDISQQESIEWKAISAGGSGNMNYYFTLYLDGEEYEVFEPQRNNTLTFMPDEDGVYHVSVYAVDGKGNKTNAAESLKTVVTLKNKIGVTGLSLSAYNAIAWQGDKLSVDTMIEPSDASIKRIRYATSNAEIATVDRDGVITIVGEEGTVDITFTPKDNPDAVKTLTITVGGEYATAVLPSGITSVQAGAFDDTAFQIIDLSKCALAEVEAGAFAKTGLEAGGIIALYLPDMITIAEGAFAEGAEDSIVVYSENVMQRDIAKDYGFAYVNMK